MITFMDADQVYQDIKTAIEAGGNASIEEYDVPTIADTCYHWVPNRGFVCNVDDEVFWEVVEKAAL